MIRKFYNADVADAGGEASVVEQPVNMAAILAQHGSKSDETGRLPEPIEIKGTKEEAKTEVTPEAATAKEEPKVEAKAEEPKTEPVAEVKVEEKAPIVQEPQKQLTLDEVLKNNQPDTILKALGFDDQKASFVSDLKDADPKLVAIMQAYKDGTLGDYVKELSTDYQKMSAEDVMRHQLRREYPKASEKALDALYKQEVIERFKLNPEDYSEAEVEEGKLLLEAKAERYRDEFSANQEKYLLPKAPEPKKDEPTVNVEEIQKQQIEAYRRELSETPYTKNIIANKSITVGEGTEAFNYPVDPNSLIDVLADAGKWVEAMYEKQTGADGKEHFTPKIEHQLLVAAFAQDSKKFLTEYAKHLKSLGAKEVIEPIENASAPEKSTPAKSEPAPANPAAAMAKHGVRSTGGY